MPEEKIPTEFTSEGELARPDLKSVLWKQLDRLNYISSIAGDSKGYINCVEALCRTLRCWKAAKTKLIGQLREVDSEFHEKRKDTPKNFQTLQMTAADKKANYCMDFIAEHLGGATGVTEVI